jgi:hypothetical protein
MGDVGAEAGGGGGGDTGDPTVETPVVDGGGGDRCAGGLDEVEVVASRESWCRQ